MAELLIEIGFEEMPAPWLEPLATGLSLKLADAATREYLDPKAVQTEWTPRRLVLRAEVLAKQPNREEPMWGPSLKVAKDGAGNWTRAAEGFAKKNRVRVADLRIEAKEAGRIGTPESDLYLVFLKTTVGRAAGEVLPGVLADALRALSFPKRMSWDAWLDDGKGAFSFGRPIRWLVALLDGVVIPFVIYRLADGGKGGVLLATGPTTVGHRFLPKGAAGHPVTVANLTELREALRRNFVLLDPGERAQKIAIELGSLAGSALLPADHGLRSEWRDLVEYPTVVSGRVPKEFQSLPRDVLETVLVHHQKYIPLPGADGNVAGFAAVTNTDGSSSAAIVQGMERVVVARLRDAAFFYAQDMKRPLEDRVSDLAGVTFHKGLGSYRDKVDRLERLVNAMTANGWLSSEQARDATEAVRLAKADLTTLMVREFPELQGIVGGLYLLAQGWSRDLADIVRWHYHPIFVGENQAPAGAFRGSQSRVFAAVALADKLDTLAGYFGIGENPTGSRDPYGLRRAAQGAVRAVLDFWWPKAGETALDLNTLLAIAVAGYPPLKQAANATTHNLQAFLLDRLVYVLSARGLAADAVAAAVHAEYPDETSPVFANPSPIRALADPIDALQRAIAVNVVRREMPTDFASLAESFKRVNNILTESVPGSSVDPKLFEGEAERFLYETIQRLEGETGSYEARLRSLATLRGPIGRFFDDVHVMADNEQVKANRLALLKRTRSLFYRIADISRLGGTS